MSIVVIGLQKRYTKTEVGESWSLVKYDVYWLKNKWWWQVKFSCYRIKIPGIHFKDQNNEQYLSSNRTIIKQYLNDKQWNRKIPDPTELMKWCRRTFIHQMSRMWINFGKAKGDFFNRVHSDQMILKIVRQEGWVAWAVAKSNSRGASSDGSHNGQAGRLDRREAGPQ
jgi:hypothetical protein